MHKNAPNHTPQHHRKTKLYIIYIMRLYDTLLYNTPFRLWMWHQFKKTGHNLQQFASGIITQLIIYIAANKPKLFLCHLCHFRQFATRNFLQPLYIFGQFTFLWRINLFWLHIRAAVWTFCRRLANRLSLIHI